MKKSPSRSTPYEPRLILINEEGFITPVIVSHDLFMEKINKSDFIVLYYLLYFNLLSERMIESMNKTIIQDLEYSVLFFESNAVLFDAYADLGIVRNQCMIDLQSIYLSSFSKN